LGWIKDPEVNAAGGCFSPPDVDDDDDDDDDDSSRPIPLTFGREYF
tara:strand:+ start:314 stop:451 length:138 start_codon:yes stop_codon:yes gene_type:complete